MKYLILAMALLFVGCVTPSRVTEVVPYKDALIVFSTVQSHQMVKRCTVAGDELKCTELKSPDYDK